MTDEKKKKLFPFFALMYSQQLDPEKYGAAQNYEEWSKLLEDNPEDANKIAEAATQLTDEQWTEIEAEYNQEISPAEKSIDLTKEKTLLAKGGAKVDTLKKLQAYKKGKKMSKKCACGCAMIGKKAKGGKMVYKCSCGCKNK